jgi:peptide/nickel transport system permease protein
MISLMKPMDRAKAMFPIPPSDFNRPRDYEGIIKKFGLDDPMHIQYWNWMVGTEDDYTGEIKGGILRGNLGWSQIGRRPVAEVIVKQLPATTELVLWSILPMIGLGLWMGVKAALNHNKFVDQLLRISAITAWSVPAFVFGLFVMFYFTSKLHMFPPGRLSLEFNNLVISEEFINYTNMHTLDAILNLRFDVFVDALSHLVLPVVTLTIANWAFLLRVTRFSMLETLQQEYLTFARSKGVPEPLVVRRHALPNALIPVITVGGLILVGLINGVVITETIFNFPGLGSFLAEAAISLDLVSVAGVTLFSSLILVFGNLIVDLLYVIVDPRIRLD